MAPEDAEGRWAPFRMRPYDRVCAGWLILHKVDNTDQMRRAPATQNLAGLCFLGSIVINNIYAVIIVIVNIIIYYY